MTELHSLKTRDDADEELARLSQVDDQARQVLDGLKHREDVGVVAPRCILSMAQRNLKAIAFRPATRTPFYTAFSEKLEGIEGLDESERQALLDRARAEIEESVIPALASLASYVTHQATLATDDAGAWKLPDGDAYYAYALRSQADLDITPDAIH